ncbi:uncharacterized protein BT62DRAFT_1073648 [Guyanagaster necrorhizus]|uniref:Uncharacterized protein n=1 Tax=Guyanagaster necrorhizus TaxID=856835 RepID=A0A9P7VY79_9AGAR|nr:uncharacterized protein BT62DRAFT_1073648 [Guyanagaster necrorhizus MCA 3950]KAG7449124.1 hypothetical protein BT62DRAFT_1073648 [Guyanagaster necrorhizus MCA 3950]
MTVTFFDVPASAEQPITRTGPDDRSLIVAGLSEFLWSTSSEDCLAYLLRGSECNRVHSHHQPPCRASLFHNFDDALALQTLGTCLKKTKLFTRRPQFNGPLNTMPLEIPSSGSIPSINVASSGNSTGSQSSSNSESSGEEGFLYPSPALGLGPSEMHEPQPILARIARFLSSDSSSSNSDEENGGLITPYSIPVDPDVEVPELGEEEGIGAGLRVPLSSPTKGVNATRSFCSASWASYGGRKMLQPERPRPRVTSGSNTRMDSE